MRYLLTVQATAYRHNICHVRGQSTPNSNCVSWNYNRCLKAISKINRAMDDQLWMVLKDQLHLWCVHTAVMIMTGTSQPWRGHAWLSRYVPCICVPCVRSFQSIPYTGNRWGRSGSPYMAAIEHTTTYTSIKRHLLCTWSLSAHLPLNTHGYFDFPICLSPYFICTKQ